MRKLSAARPETLHAQHDNTPSPGNPPPRTRQPSGTSTTTLRPRQPSATRPPALQGVHDNTPPAATLQAPHGNSPAHARQPSGPPQPSAQNTATIRDHHSRPPATATSPNHAAAQPRLAARAVTRQPHLHESSPRRARQASGSRQPSSKDAVI